MNKKTYEIVYFQSGNMKKQTIETGSWEDWGTLVSNHFHGQHGFYVHDVISVTLVPTNDAIQ